MNDTLQHDFLLLPDLIRHHATRAAQRLALDDGAHHLTYGELDTFMDRVASALQRDGLHPGDAVALCASSSTNFAAVFLGALRAGVVVAPLAPGATPQSLARMAADAQARLLFTDAGTSQTLGATATPGIPRVTLDGSAAGRALTDWLAPEPVGLAPVAIGPAAPFNIIYSSGTTGEPKGIVQSHGMRWTHVRRGATYGYGSDTVTLLSTPLYSNTTLVVLFPTLAFGGTVRLMPKFDTLAYLTLAQLHRVTHTMLVPVQYQRLMAQPEFDRFDLSSFHMKFSTSAPFGAPLKADVLARWPGGLVEFYGMTEGGGTCILDAHVHPDKLHTVGRPAEGHDIRLIDEAGRELPPGETGEVVGHSGGMMTGYFGRPEQTREAEWFDPAGKRFIRTGDVGRFDADGFLTLLDRRKDMIISGGFNIYPSDLEAVLREHPAVLEAAVVGVPSEAWGETPLAFVVRRASHAAEPDELMAWVNARVGKTQRLSSVHLIDDLPRSAIGKILKRELRDRVLPSR
ncbi:MAG: class I adenylate-forming enzyme family protein [Burkholderiaceae bacterium]|uniref:class I adenylate-forming enzyme family protein n=1 Tax=Hydrogenophaga sp. TaxID=1904254 RepID=UPI00275D885A|nr:class I adenylate-forming enzyme family protein [Hydrogenophaga sp.]MDP2065911.1 class I adenylate-forming enzyme family protein [Burkholderiaceae bacterium]MDZ4144021.1 class I adenylate-forming enzyme family protein [Burkholderiales bacterium]MDZ4398846.1 class I adenylate-forming enzyme family protein [Hydrogenophaga sp.]